MEVDVMSKMVGAQGAEPAASEEAPADDPADRLAAMVDPPRSGATLTLSTGHTAAVAPNEPDRLTIRGPAGEVELSIRFTPEGPVLRFASAAIDLQSKGDIRLDCDRLQVRAREGIDLSTGGDLRQTAGGDAVIHADKTAITEGQSVTVYAATGKVEVDAVDDVDIHGRRILLNS
jgi:uncharacterized protein (DUF2345 family)